MHRQQSGPRCFDVLLLVVLLPLTIPIGFVHAARLEVCFINDFDPLLALHGHVTHDALASAFSIESRLRVVQAVRTPVLTAVEWLLQNGTTCDVVVGPFAIDVALATQAMISPRAFLTFLKTSVQSRRELGRGFTNVAHQEVHLVESLSVFFQYFNFKRAALISETSLVGVDVASTASAVMSGIGGRLESVFTVPPAEVSSTAKTTEEISAALSSVLSPVIIVHLAPSDAALGILVERAIASGMHRRFVFVFLSEACAARNVSSILFPGAFCVSEPVLPTGRTDLSAAWAAQNQTTLASTAAGLRLGPGDIASAQSTLGQGWTMPHLLSDAFETVFTAVNRSAAADGTSVDRDALRSMIGKMPAVDGATGKIKFDKEGFRSIGGSGLYNVHGDGSTPRVATIGARGIELSNVHMEWLGRDADSAAPTALEFLALTTVRLCYVYQSLAVATQAVLHSQYAVQRYASEYAVSYTFSATVLEGGTSLGSVSAAVLSAQRDCDVFLGPPTSFVSTSVSALIKRPWISDTASSTTLSDKDTHPWFSRVIPSDSIAGSALAGFMQQFGFVEPSVICSDEEYGRSVSTAFTSAFAGTTVAGRSARIRTTNCIAASADNATADAALNAATSPVLVLAALPGTSAHRSLVSRIIDRDLHASRVVVLVECTPDGDDDPIRLLNGAFCITFLVNETLVAEYMPGFEAWASAPYEQYVANSSMVAVNISEMTTWSALALDGAKYAMSTLDTHARRQGLEPTDSATLLQVLRNGSVMNRGLTGPVGIDSTTGDRLNSTVVLKNIVAGVQLPVGLWTGEAGVEMDAPTDAASSSSLVWMDGTYVGNTAPVLFPAAEEDSVLEIPSYVFGIAIAVAVFLVLVAWFVHKFRTLSPEAFGRAISSGLLLYCGQLLFQMADLAADIAACVVLVESDTTTLEIEVLYSVLVAVATVTSLLEMGFLVITLREVAKGSPQDIDNEAARMRHLEYAELLTMLCEDIPMLIINAFIVVADDDPPWVIVVPLIVSSFAFGMKAAKLGPVMWHIWTKRAYERDLDLEAHELSVDQQERMGEILDQFEIYEPGLADAERRSVFSRGMNIGGDGTDPLDVDSEGHFPPPDSAVDESADGNPLAADGSSPDSDDDSGYDGVAQPNLGQQRGGIEPSFALPIAGAPIAHKNVMRQDLMRRVKRALDCLLCDPIDVDSPQARADFFAVFLEMMLPLRFQLLQRTAESTARYLVSANVSQNEFYAVVLPYLAVLYDHDDGDDDVEKSHIHAGHFSAMECIQLRRSSVFNTGLQSSNSVVQASTAPGSSADNVAAIPSFGDWDRDSDDDGGFFSGFGPRQKTEDIPSPRRPTALPSPPQSNHSHTHSHVRPAVSFAPLPPEAGRSPSNRAPRSDGGSSARRSDGAPEDELEVPNAPLATHGAKGDTNMGTGRDGQTRVKSGPVKEVSMWRTPGESANKVDRASVRMAQKAARASLRRQEADMLELMALEEAVKDAEAHVVASSGAPPHRMSVESLRDGSTMSSTSYNTSSPAGRLARQQTRALATVSTFRKITSSVHRMRERQVVRDSSMAVHRGAAARQRPAQRGTPKARDGSQPVARAAVDEQVENPSVDAPHRSPRRSDVGK